MKLHNRSSKGFTLVEIMIVVVIIGLLAAMAIPAFQKVRQSALEKTVINDARQLGSAAQQYFMEYGANTVTYSYTNTDGKLTGPLTAWVSQLSKNYTMSGTTAGQVNATDTTDAFSIALAGAFTSTPATFNAEGKKTN